MNFSSDAMADFEGLLEVNRKICKQQMAEKASPTLPTNCAVLPKLGVTDSASLAREEEKISKKKAAWLFENGTLDTLPVGSFAAL